VSPLAEDVVFLMMFLLLQMLLLRQPNLSLATCTASDDHGEKHLLTLVFRHGGVSQAKGLAYFSSHDFSLPSKWCPPWLSKA
jgi:hypothetical protein